MAPDKWWRSAFSRSASEPWIRCFRSPDPSAWMWDESMQARISSVAFRYGVEWSGSYDRALMPLAAMLIVSGCVLAAIDPSQEMIRSQNVRGAQTERTTSSVRSMSSPVCAVETYQRPSGSASTPPSSNPSAKSPYNAL
jgi:hypothetical protein